MEANVKEMMARLEMLEWMTLDAKREIVASAKAMSERTAAAAEASDALLNGQPVSFDWIASVETHLNNARRAKDELVRLCQEQRRLRAFLDLPNDNN